jgi:hypothetical protein
MYLDNIGTRSFLKISYQLGTCIGSFVKLSYQPGFGMKGFKALFFALYEIDL